MGRKRKRAQSKQNWGATTSRKQKKRRKIRGKGFNRGTKTTKSVDASQIDKLSNSNATTGHMMLENISREISISSGERKQELSLPCSIPGNECSKTVRFSRISTIFSRLNCFATMFQRLTLERFRSIRSIFLLLDWLRQIFGCGLQALGKNLLGKDNKMLADGRNNFSEVLMRMTHLEEEVTFLKSELAKKTSCLCGDHATLCTSTKQGHVVPSLPLTNAPFPPPPPPPPPPPVLPPPAPPLAFLKNKQTGSKSMSSNETKLKKPPTTLVTLEDLKKIKLRKVSQEVAKEKNKENIEPGFKIEPKKASLKKTSQRRDLPQCVISLREIKKVTLKKTKTVKNELEKIVLRTPDEMIMTRKNLRKVNITRSPGGTPLVSDRNSENGTGLTPMMTKALRRKFQQAHPYSSPESPTGRRKRKSLSPMVNYSPNTPSPLLINKF